LWRDKQNRKNMQINPIAHFHSPFSSKFGVPKQSGMVRSLPGEIVFLPKYRNPDAVRGLDAFDFIWLVWGFSANRHASQSPVVRPPILGGNERIGVFATRSPYRPNALGLSSVQLASIDIDMPRGPVINVLGADLMDGTPIYDIKPYLTYADCHTEARCGFIDNAPRRRPLQVVIPPETEAKIAPALRSALREALALDPRPRYHDDPARVYGMPFAGFDVHFRVDGDVLTVVGL